MTMTLSNPNEMRREMARRKGARERALDALRIAGARGVLNTDLMAIAGSRAGGRVQELRDQGFDIPCVPIDRDAGLYRYTLVREPGQAPKPGEPGYLQSLQPIASINPRVRITPDTDDSPRDGCLF